MTEITVWMWTGFLLAAYSVIANDSIQTLGTWIASNKKVNWEVYVGVRLHCTSDRHLVRMVGV